MPSSHCSAPTSPSSNTEFLTLLPLVGQAGYASPRLPAFGRALDGNLSCAALQQPTRARANASASVVANQYVQGVLTNLQAPPAAAYIGQFWAGPGFGNNATLAASYTSTAQNGQTTSGSTTITSLSSTAGLYVGQGVSGSGVAAGSFVTSVPSSSTVVLSAAASVSASNVALSFAAGYSFAGTTGGLPGGLQTYVGQAFAPARTVDSATASVGGIDPTNTQVGVTMRQGVITDFVVGDVVLIINQQGDATYNSNVGAWEMCQVAAVSAANFAITFAAPLVNLYGQSGNTTLGNQKVVLYRVPEYGQLSINAGGLVSPAAWDGLSGGVCALFAQQLTCAGGGAVIASAYGYRAASDGASAQSEGHLGGYNTSVIAGNSGAALGSMQLGTPGGVGASGGAITVNVSTLFANGGGGGGGGGQGGNAGSGGGHATAGVVGTGQGGGGGAGLSGQGWYSSSSGLTAGATPSQGTGGVAATGGTSGTGNTSTTWGGGGSGGSVSSVGGAPPAGVSVGAPQLPQLLMGGAGSAAGSGGYGGGGNAGGKITNTNTTSGVVYGGAGGGAGGNGGGGYTGVTTGQGGAGGTATVSAGSGFTGSSGTGGNTASSSGFGGNGGGIVLIFAKGIDAAVIRSDGQTGATGSAGAAGASGGQTQTQTAAFTYGGAGGGGGGQAGAGGGAGGTVLLVAQRLGSISVMTAAPGAGGLGGLGGAAGAVGGSGQAGASGASGAAGASGRIKVVYQSLGGAPSGAAGADGAGVFTVSSPAAYKTTL